MATTSTYPVYEIRITNPARHPLYADRVALTVQRPYPQQSGTARTEPLHDGEPIAVVEIESDHPGSVCYGGEGGDQEGQVVDFGGPFGPGGIRRCGGRGLVNDALLGLPGYRLIDGDREYLARYLYTKAPATA